ncbi:MAG: class I tRNA ligase family protein, partial [Rubripirellula sp.]
TQAVMAHGLDTLLRLLHPTMPFVTEVIWEHLNQVANRRGLSQPAEASPFVMKAPWPVAQMQHFNESIERQFAEFQEVVSAIRKIRASQNIAPRETVPVAVRCSESSKELLEPMKESFISLAQADVVAFGSAVKPFETDAPLAIPSIDIDVHVDLEKFIDIGAELARLDKLMTQITKQIAGKVAKLSNENFVSRAPEDVVQRERQSLDELKNQQASVAGDIDRLKAKS